MSAVSRATLAKALSLLVQLDEVQLGRMLARCNRQSATDRLLEAQIYDALALRAEFPSRFEVTQ